MKYIFIMIGLALFIMSLAAPANAEVYGCQIGKPSYCFKYGGTRCEASNTTADKITACQNWTAACIDCHGKIPNCIGSRRPLSSSPVCTRCSTSWLTCMKKIDAKFWPNRMK